MKKTSIHKSPLDIDLYLKQWEYSHGIIFYKHQLLLIKASWQLIQETGEFVLAAALGSGKTLMSIVLIDAYLEQNPGAKVLVLTHAQVLLRSQYFQECNKMVPNFSYHELEYGIDFADKYRDVDVMIAIPQSLQFLKSDKITNIKFDLVVVDEAHQQHLTKTAQAIMDNIKPEVKILMTATPAPFVLRNYRIIPFALFDLPESLVSKIDLSVIGSKYDYDLQDFNSDFELTDAAQKKHITEDLTHITLKNLVDDILNLIGSEKSVFACRSQRQAMYVCSFFKSIGINATLSISDTDKTSAELVKFKENPDIQVLVVVGRAILGFDYAELLNFIDMTGTQNINSISQMYGRVARPHPDGIVKKFIKIVPDRDNMIEWYSRIMDASLFLASGQWLLKYNGKNFYQLEMPQRIDGTTSRKSSKKGTTTKSNTPIRTVPISYDGLPTQEIFKAIAEAEKYGNVLEGYTTTTMGEARAVITGFEEWRNMSDARILQFIIRLAGDKKIVTWNHIPNAVVPRINKIGYDKFCKDLLAYGVVIKREIQSAKKTWTLEMCMESSAPFNSIRPWQKSDPAAYQQALKNNKEFGWLDRCREHMTGGRVTKLVYKSITIETILESAAKYKTYKEWLTNDKIIYQRFMQIRKDLDKTDPLYNPIIISRKKTAYEIFEEGIINEGYKTPEEWKEKNLSAWRKMTKNQWTEKIMSSIFGITDHVKYFLELNRTEKYNECVKVASTCKSVKEFYKYKKLVDSAKHYRFLEDVLKPLVKLDLEKESLELIELKTEQTFCIEMITASVTWADLQRRSPKAYRIVQKNREFFDQYSTHFNFPGKYDSWTESMFVDAAKVAKTFAHFRKSGPGIKARKLGLLQKIAKDAFGIDYKIKIFWTNETAKLDAKKYNQKYKWVKAEQGAYQYARKQGKAFLAECCLHMKPKFLYTEEFLINEALLYSSSAEWRKANPSGPVVAKRKQIYDKCTAHFKK